VKYCAIDIETSGLNPDTCQILQVAAVYDDLNIRAPIESLPKIEFYVVEKIYKGEPYALAMNVEIFKKLAGKELTYTQKVCSEDILPKLRNWLTSEVKLEVEGKTLLSPGIVKINVAGKNFANFDNLFFRKLKSYGESIAFHYRILDVSSLYFDPGLDTKCLPSTEECMKRARIPGSVAHTALEDAINVVELIRVKFPLR
jgi:oligoribonuclease (3'-5' exoribonuclease)